MTGLTVSIVHTPPPPHRWTRYIMANGDKYIVNRFGWVLTIDGEPVAHPLVDDVMRAIIRFEGKPWRM